MSVTKCCFKYFIALASITCGLSSAIAAVQNSEHRLTKEQLVMIEDVVEEYCEANVFFGNIQVTTEDDVTFESSCGPQNIEYDVANTMHSKFRIGSNTKAFAAVILMRLLRDKDLMSETIGDYLPWFPQNQCADVSLHHLLTMSSGINNYSNNELVYDNFGWRPFLYDQKFNLSGPESFGFKFCSCGLSAGQKGAPSFTPGSKFEYSNCNYYLIGNIIEQIVAGGQGSKDDQYWFSSVLDEHILEPLNMTDSGSFSPIGVYENMTTGYIHRDNPYLSIANGRPPSVEGVGEYWDILVNPYSNPLVLYAAGDMYSNVGDMHKWDQGLQGDLILNARDKEVAYSPFTNTESDVDCEYFGYGWFVTYIDPKKYGKVDCPKSPTESQMAGYEKFLQYSGSYPYAWVTNFTRLLERNQTIMVFSNYVKTGIESDCIGKEIRNIIYYQRNYRTTQCAINLDNSQPDAILF